MRTIVAFVALALPAALTAQTGQFVVRLGTDTLAIEQYTRTQLEWERTRGWVPLSRK